MALREASVLAIHPIFVGLLDRVVSGPAYYGSVVDEQGKPLHAKITLSGQKLYHGEQWKTRKTDGFFFRLLPKKGSYVVGISAKDYSSKEVKIQVGSQPHSIGTITLKPKE